LTPRELAWGIIGACDRKESKRLAVAHGVGWKALRKALKKQARKGGGARGPA